MWSLFEEGEWFAPKKIGYGAGLPIAWQGWVLLLVYLLGMLSLGWLMEWDLLIGGTLALILATLGTLLVVAIAKRKTRGGWRMRYGGEDEDSRKP